MWFDELLFLHFPGRFGQHQLHADFSMAAAEMTMMAMVSAAVEVVMVLAIAVSKSSWAINFVPE